MLSISRFYSETREKMGNPFGGDVASRCPVPARLLLWLVAAAADEVT